MSNSQILFQLRLAGQPRRSTRTNFRRRKSGTGNRQLGLQILYRHLREMLLRSVCKPAQKLLCVTSSKQIFTFIQEISSPKEKMNQLGVSQVFSHAKIGQCHAIMTQVHLFPAIDIFFLSIVDSFTS